MSLARSRLITILRAALQAVYARRLRKYPALVAVLSHFDSSTSAAVDLADAIALYEYVRRQKPRCLLELGPGTSTNIICAALRENMNEDPGYHPEFLAFEENPKWLQYHEDTFIPDLRLLVDMRASGIGKKMTPQGPAVFYTDVPKKPYDFVMIDGPDHLSRDCAWSSDVIDHQASMAKNAFVVFDGREETVRRPMRAFKIGGQSTALSRHRYSLCYEWRNA